MADDKPPRRLQSATERDMAGIAARREREMSPQVLAIPKPVTDEITDRYDDPDERAEKRSSLRTLPQRVGHLEQKLDEHAAAVGEWRIETAKDFGDVKAELGKLTGAVSGLTVVVESERKREHLTFTAKVDVDRAQALDTIDEKKAKRELRAKLVGAAVGGGGVITALLHLLKVL